MDVLWCDTENVFLFLCITSFLYSTFTLHIGNMLSFFVVVSRNKKTFNPSFTPPDIRKQLLSAALEKKFLLSRFILCKTFVIGSYYSKISGFFPATLAKINTVTRIFQGFYLDFKKFSVVCNISRRLPNARFRKFEDIFSDIQQSFSCCSDLA